jgi:5-methylcytosine-specific restriction endonuclease McrA
MKTCRDCRVEKPLDDFYRHSETRDGRAAYCKPCVRERVRASRAAKPDMYARQKRDSIAAARARFETDPEPKRAYERRRYAEHKQSYRDRARASYIRNSEGYKLRAKQRKLRLRGAWTPEGDAYAAFIANDPCVYCGGRASTTDHIVSLIGGGLHEPDNLASACLSCNARKQDSPLLLYLLARIAA